MDNKLHYVFKKVFMFKRLFGNKKNLLPAAVSPKDISFIGDIQGNGVQALRFEVGKVLRSLPEIRNAYFSKLKYKNEEKFRIALIIEATNTSNDLGREIAKKCVGICDMDLMFSSALDETMLIEIFDKCEPIFSTANLLFECPIIVSWNLNAEMPKKWEKAILFYYVAAPDFKSALNKAVQKMRDEGFIYERVYHDKISQLEPSVWWEQLVMRKWPKQSDHFPTQEEIQLLIVTGGVHRGPALEWCNGAD